MTTVTPDLSEDRHDRSDQDEPVGEGTSPAPERESAAGGTGTAGTPAAGPADPRRAALLRFAISITVLNILGHTLLGFEQPPIAPILAVLTAYSAAFVLEYVDAWAHGRVPEYAGGGKNLFYFLLPAHIAALACSMLLYAGSVRFYLFATVVSVASKYVFRVFARGRLRHFLNPSNCGICVTLLLFPIVGFTPPYMFTNNTDTLVDWLLPAAILTLGTMLNAKLTKRMPLILAWVGGYVLQAVVRQVLFDDPIWATLGMMTGVAFVLFTNYMITDPGTTPMSARGQVIFGLTSATVYCVLIVSQIAYAIFFALAITCLLRGTLLFLNERRTRWEARHV